MTFVLRYVFIVRYIMLLQLALSHSVVNAELLVFAFCFFIMRGIYLLTLLCSRVVADNQVVQLVAIGLIRHLDKQRKVTFNKS